MSEAREEKSRVSFWSLRHTLHFCVAENYLGTKAKNAVITVPAYFNDSQRQVGDKMQIEMLFLTTLRHSLKVCRQFLMISIDYSSLSYIYLHFLTHVLIGQRVRHKLNCLNPFFTSLHLELKMVNFCHSSAGHVWLQQHVQTSFQCRAIL